MKAVLCDDDKTVKISNFTNIFKDDKPELPKAEDFKIDPIGGYVSVVSSFLDFVADSVALSTWKIETIPCL